ncbi:MAG: anthranilate phosphoribosyltransferase [Bacteroidota bacterium]|nr:anthranilate phosphoribosyltransferase [Candidatus Kapabacteria bacterium]MDW8219155.1 anthranilate phosphoribosyltransferase [Bacteroidota bacterium]
MKDILQYLFEHNTLSKHEAKTVLTNIAAGAYSDAHIIAFLTVFMMRSITVEELSGFREALLELCIRVDLDGIPAIDMCGTGGDGKDTFNISTTAMFIAAGAGINVAKHGNYGVSSVSGSSNVLQCLGYEFTSSVDKLRRSLETSGICFMHAPLFHPAMKAVAPLRQALGMRTFFNMLGPLVNPAFPPYQLTGVFSMELARIYSYILQYDTTKQGYIILRALDGYDEISLTGPWKQISQEKEELLTPAALGFEHIQPEELRGGATPEDSAHIVLHILKGEGTAAHNAVAIANAAMAIHCVQPQTSMSDAVEIARESLLSGKAFAALKAFMQW